jgi:hypothetical protein
MNCPGSEQAAAHADGRLDAAESARFLEHCSECEDCRRALAILCLPRESGKVPLGLESRAISALRRSLDRDRERTPRPFRRIAPAPLRTAPVGFAIAAGLLAGFIGLLLMARQSPVRVREPREVVRTDPLPESEPPRESVAPLPREIPRPEAPPKSEVAEAPTPVLPKPEESRVEPLVESAVRDVPKPEGSKPEEPPKPPSHTVVARALSELQITDITGSLSIHRKSAKAKERLSGVARLGEGDILTAEKSASFRVEGRHPVVLSDNASISMAYVAQEQAPWLQVQSGEATVESTGSARWVVTDGRVAVAIKPARARFMASRTDARLSLIPLTEPIYVQPDGGRIHALRPGEELQVGRSSADVRPLETGAAGRKNSAFDAARPRQRTIFYTSCDPADAKREHFFVQEGGWLKNEALLSRERGDRDRTSAVAIGPNPRFAWRDSLVVRFRFMTNCKSVETSLRVDEKKYTMLKGIAVDRKNLNQWVGVELPFSPLMSWPFRRDDGVNQLMVSTEDKFDSIRFTVKQQDVFGDQKAYVVIDDIQVVDKE